MGERLDADVTVIGGGAGCAAALALRKRGLRVVLLDKGFCGAGATGVNFGGVRQQGRHLAELPIAFRSREIWQNLQELVGDDCEYRATGHLKLARNDADMATLEDYARDAGERGSSCTYRPQPHPQRLSWLGDRIVGCVALRHRRPGQSAPARPRVCAHGARRRRRYPRADGGHGRVV